MESQLEGKYELRKGGRLGPGDQDAKEILVLNRTIRWMEQGLQYEADPSQGERLLVGLGLTGQCNSVATPGLKPLLEQLVGDKVLPASEVTFRVWLAARTICPPTASTSSLRQRRCADS